MTEKTGKSGATLVPPYVPYRSFRNFIDGLKQGIPARIDRSVMSSMSGALQSQLAAALRYFELVTPAGTPTPALPVVVNSEGPERVKNLRLLIHSAYPFLFDKTKFDLMGATPRMLEEQFAHTGASGGTIDKCINFFLAAAKDADIALSPHLKNGRGVRTPRTRSRTRSSEQSSSSESLANHNEGSGDLSWAQMLLSKFPSFDPAWPDDVKAKWFDAFDKLMKQSQPK